MNGTSALISAGVTSRESMPQFLDESIRRRSSFMRVSERATSRPPHSVYTSHSRYWRALSRVSSAISLLWSTRNRKFEAWPVEPPGLGRGPLSTWTMSRQPSRAR